MNSQKIGHSLQVHAVWRSILNAEIKIIRYLI